MEVYTGNSLKKDCTGNEKRKYMVILRVNHGSNVRGQSQFEVGNDNTYEDYRATVLPI